MISIIMPAYNEEKNIKKAIESILNQTNKDFELIIVNDGSQDNTVNIVEEFAAKYKQIIFINPKKKIGKVSAYNIASKQVSGDWIYFMGADDTLPLNSFEIWGNKVDNLDPNKRIALRGRLEVKSNNKKYDGLILPKNKERMNYSGPITLLSKAMHKFILPIPENLPNEDNLWSLSIKYFADIQIAVDDIVVYYSIHDGNSISRNDSFISFTEKYHRRYLVRDNFINRYKEKLTDKEIQELKRELICENLRYNQKSLSVLLMKNINLLTKLRMFMLSAPSLYKIKLRFDRYLLGH